MLLKNARRRGVHIPNAEIELKDPKYDALAKMRVEVEGPWPDGSGGLYTDTLIIYPGTTTVLDLFRVDEIGNLMASADEIDLGTSVKTGEEAVVLWWD